MAAFVFSKTATFWLPPVLQTHPPHARLNWARNPLNQNFRAEVRKFLRVEWIATIPNGLVPSHSQNQFRAHLKRTILVLKLDNDFDGDINDIV